MQRVVIRCAVVLVLGLSVVSARGAELSGRALLVVDNVEINQGADYPLVVQARRGTWLDNTPFHGEPDHMTIWFPTEKPAVVEGLAWRGRFDVIAAGQVQAWVGGAWKTVAELPVKEIPRGYRQAASSIRFAKPVTTHGLRLQIDDIANTDHAVLEVVNIRLQGTLPKGDAVLPEGALKLSCEAEFNVVDLPGPVVVNATLNNPGKVDRTVHLQAVWQTTEGDAVEAEPIDQAVTIPAGKSTTVPVHLAGVPQGPYRLHARLVDPRTGAVLSARGIVVGLRDKALAERAEVEPFVVGAGRAVEVPTIEQRLAGQGMIWSTEASQGVCFFGRRPGPDVYKRTAGVGGNLVMQFVTYKQFEPLPGVYNLALTDRLVTMAGDHGVGLSLGLWRWDFGKPTQWWLADQRVVEHDGSRGRDFSVHASHFRKHATRAVEIMVKRYQNSPTVWLWHPHPYGMVDHDGHGVVDKHPEAVAAWQVYLKEKYKTVAALNRVHGSDHKAFEDVPVPVPMWKTLEDKGRHDEACRVLDVRPVWVDWLDFYHGGFLQMRVSMMELVRRYDRRRGFDGTNASGGVGKADAVFAALKEHRGFYGDQGINLLHHVRRMVAKRRHGLPLRHEDISPVTVGRRGMTVETIVDRCDWDLFQASTLGPKHFNYIFTTWDGSPFWDRVYANERARRLLEEASASRIVERPVGYLHSFVTDVHAGRYNYNGISIQRWWVMGGFSAAMVAPGQWFETFSDGCPREALDRMKLLVDDGSRVLPGEMVDRLVRFVEAGGKLVLNNTSGERTIDRPDRRYELLERLGYTDLDGLARRQMEPAILVFRNGNGVFRRTVSLPVQFWSALQAPEGGRNLGTVGDAIGAVTWTHGQGQVVLLAGVPGSIEEPRVQALMRKRNRYDKKSEAILWGLWGNAEREQIGIARSMMRDLSEWAGVPPQFTLSDDFNAVMRELGEVRLVYLHNNGPVQQPVLRMPVEAVSRWSVVVETPTDTTELGLVDGKTLNAPGIALPRLESKRYMAVRLTPEK